MNKEETDLMVKYFFEKDNEKVIVCALKNKKVKAIVTST
jgi:hypothetical protein